MWKDILKAPPFDAVRYEKRVSTPRQMTFPSFFSQVLDTYIENAIRSKRVRNPSKSKKRKYTVYFSSDDVKKYRKYLDKMVGESTPTGRMVPTGYGKREAEYTRDFTDKIKQKMLQEYNMDSIRLIRYRPLFGEFNFEFTLTDEGNAGNMEKVAGPVTTSSPAHSHLFRPTFGGKRKRKKKKDEDE